MKKLTFVIDDITETGGVERVTTFLSNNLSSEYNVSIVSIYGHGKTQFYTLNKNISVTFIENKGFFSKNIKLARILKKSNSDYIISMSMGRLSFRLAILNIVFNFDAKLILSEHNSFRTSGRLVQFLKLLSYKFSDETIFLTNFDRDLISQKIKLNSRVIPNFSIYESVSLTSVTPKQKIVLAIGRLSYQKGFDRAIKIWSMLPRNDWKLLIVGKDDGNAREQLQDLISSYNLDDSIEIREPTANIDSIYSISSIYMMTSRFEGLPLVLIESKSFGLPGIAFDCETGPSEIINDGVDGFIIRDNNCVDFAKKLNILMSDNSLRECFSRAALCNAKEFSQEKYLFSWKNIFN